MFPMATPLMGGGLRMAALVYSGTLPCTPGAQQAVVGDLAIVSSANTDPVSSPGGGWNVFNVGGGDVQIYWRKLTAADIAAPIAGGVSQAPILIFRDASSIVPVSARTIDGNAFSSVLAGFAPNERHAGLVAIGRSFGGGNDAVGVSAPTGFALRGSVGYYYNFHNNDPNYVTRATLYTRLSPPNQIYSGQTFTMTWSSNTGSMTLNVCELRN